MTYADDATDAGLVAWTDHLIGRCGGGGPCPYCEAYDRGLERAAVAVERFRDELAAAIRRLKSGPAS